MWSCAIETFIPNGSQVRLIHPTEDDEISLAAGENPSLFHSQLPQGLTNRLE